MYRRKLDEMFTFAHTNFGDQIISEYKKDPLERSRIVFSNAEYAKQFVKGTEDAYSTSFVISASQITVYITRK